MQIVLSCPNGHIQKIEVQGMTLEMAKDYCQMLDGTSPFFVHSPIGDPNTRIGKCITCGANFSAQPETN